MFKKFNAANPDFVNTSEAYSKTIFVGGNNIAIPYINVALMPDNPVNGIHSVVDYSYYVLTGVRSMSFNASKGKLIVDFNSKLNKDYITTYVMAGGYGTGNGAEVKIECEGLFFYLPETAKINPPFHPFVPLDTPKFRQNLNTDETASFFSITDLLQGVKEALGDNIYNLIWY